MPPATTRMVLGYTMRVTSLKFSDGLVAGNSEHRGCVSYGQWPTGEWLRKSRGGGTRAAGATRR